MMKTLTAGLGLLTILAVTGAMTPWGQTMLGFRPATENEPSVTVIKDTPPPVAKTAPNVITPAPASAHSAPAPAPAAARAPGAPSAQASPVQTGLGAVASIATILLNLPQVLAQTQVRPAPGNEEVRPIPGIRRPPGTQRETNTRRRRGTTDDSPH